MHQDRNNGNWPELKRKKQRLAFDEDTENRSKTSKNYFAKNTNEVTKTKNIKADNMLFNNKVILDEFVDDETVDYGKSGLNVKDFR